MKSDDKLLIKALKQQKTERPPIWMMRQAGRYLPEYQATRAKAGSFLDLCFNPELAVEVTLQPIRRFGFDGAILFSDILVIPLALGQKVWFEEGHGPRLEALEKREDLAKLSPGAVKEKLSPVFETLRGLRSSLPAETALIGFAGAPWTIASYMIEGGTSRDFMKSRRWAYEDEESFGQLIDLLSEATADYLIEQIDNGAEAVQLFDSWAGVWPADQFERWCLEPARKIVQKIKSTHPNVPVIAFPRGAGLLYETFAETSGADALGIDTTLAPEWVRDRLQDKITPQGNLDPVALLAGGPQLQKRVRHIVECLQGGPFVFNLGHGILPKTPIAHVEAVVESVRDS